MGVNIHLRNAAVICENPDVVLLAEGDHLHAVESRIAELKKDKCMPAALIPLMRNAHTALVQFTTGIVDAQILDAVSLKANEMEQLKEKIRNIYAHLPHHVKNQLCSMIHHKQA